MANNLDAISKDNFLSEEERLSILKAEVESTKELKEDEKCVFDGNVDLKVLAAKAKYAKPRDLKELVSTGYGLAMMKKIKRDDGGPSEKVLTITMEHLDMALEMLELEFRPAPEKQKGPLKPASKRT